MGYQPEDFDATQPTLPQDGPATLPVGAVDAPAGSKLYELARRQGGASKPKQRRPQMSEAQRAAREQQRRQDTFASLVSKMVAGTGMERPGENMIPFSAMPEEVRGLVTQVTGEKFPIGWDPSQLTPEERLMMAQLQSMQQKKFAQQNPDAIDPETAPAPGQPGAPNLNSRGRY